MLYECATRFKSTGNNFLPQHHRIKFWFCWVNSNFSIRRTIWKLQQAGTAFRWSDVAHACWSHISHHVWLLPLLTAPSSSLQCSDSYSRCNSRRSFTWQTNKINGSENYSWMFYDIRKQTFCKMWNSCEGSVWLFSNQTQSPPASGHYLPSVQSWPLPPIQAAVS